MRVEIKTSGFDLTDGLRDHTRRRLEFAFDWARHHVGTVAITLSDINGPRGGKDKRCQIRIPLPGHRDVLIRDTESDLYTAIDRAANRAGQTLERRLCRLQDSAIRQERSLSRIAQQSDPLAVLL